MAVYRCKVCSAVYVSPQLDGSSYFHACSPVHNAAYEAQFVIDDKGERVPKGKMDPLIPEMRERADKRNENIEVKPDGKVGPKAEGAGKDTLP